jgi:TonB family protein
VEEDNNIIQFGAADIERYHKGLMNAKEMHAIEKAAMDDPFLADALDGYNLPGANISADLNELKNRLSKRTKERKLIVAVKKSPYYFLRVAAMIVIVAGAGWLAYTFLNNENAVAKSEVAATVTIDRNNLTDTTANLNRQVAADSSAGTFAGLEKIKDYRTNAIIARDSISPSFFNTDTGKIDVAVANTTRNTGEIVINAGKAQQRTLEAPGTLEAPAIKVQKEEDKKQLSEVVVTEKREKAVADEEFAFKKSNRQDNAFDNLSKRSKSSPSPVLSQNGAFKDSGYKKDTTNYNRLNIFKGRVTDGFNNGIPFANVTISDVNVGTYADARGFFNLVAPDTTLNVSLRAVGFNNSQIQLRNSLPTNEVVLQEDRSLNAIVKNNNKPNANRSRSSAMVLTEPEPSDGWENYDCYLANNLVVPEQSERKQKKGEVEVAFEVNSKGEPVNIKVTKSLCKECDEEAIRLVKDGPRWKRKSKKEKARVTIQF